jgi:lactate racemase
MTLKAFRLPQNAWFGDAAVEITLPSDWEIMVAEIPADRCEALTDAGIRERLDHPIASPSLNKLAQQKNKAVIIFDDLSRPTKLEKSLPM